MPQGAGLHSRVGNCKSASAIPPGGVEGVFKQGSERPEAG